MTAMADKIEGRQNKVSFFASSPARKIKTCPGHLATSPKNKVGKKWFFVVLGVRNLVLRGLSEVAARSNLIVRPTALQPITHAAVLYRMYRTDSIPRGVDGNA